MTKNFLNIPPAWMGLAEFAFFVAIGVAAGNAGWV
tara:strand:+ start:828 stop:932 length:105 start_codon:yes stop_codon:yes gene_type:complete